MIKLNEKKEKEVLEDAFRYRVKYMVRYNVRYRV